MPDGIGFSFQPGASGTMPGGRRGATTSGNLSPQEAIRILSLRVPERASPRGIAPLPLLQSQGSGAALGPGLSGMGGEGLNSLIAAIMGQFRVPIPNVPGIPPTAWPSQPTEGMGGGGGGSAPAAPNPWQQFADEVQGPVGPPAGAIGPPRITPGDNGQVDVPWGPTPDSAFPLPRRPQEDAFSPMQDMQTLF